MNLTIIPRPHSVSQHNQSLQKTNNYTYNSSPVQNKQIYFGVSKKVLTGPLSALEETNWVGFKNFLKRETITYKLKTLDNWSLEIPNCGLICNLKNRQILPMEPLNSKTKEGLVRPLFSKLKPEKTIIVSQKGDSFTLDGHPFNNYGFYLVQTNPEGILTFTNIYSGVFPYNLLNGTRMIDPIEEGLKRINLSEKPFNDITSKPSNYLHSYVHSSTGKWGD